MNQLLIHKKIDTFFEGEIASASFEVAKDLCKTNTDSVVYFFVRADELWFDWLLSNGFLNKIKEVPADPDVRLYRMPELEYLSRMVEKVPVKVAEFILSVPISEEVFNPEVIDRFTWMISDLPSEQIVRLSKKINDEDWVYLMRRYGKSGYQFDKILKKLSEVKEYESILHIARAMLTVRNQEDFDATRAGYSIENPFYLEHISDVGIFEILLDAQGEYLEKCLVVLAEVLGKIVRLRAKDSDGVFEYENSFSLYDADLFSVDFKQRSISPREDVENLVVAIVKIISCVMSESCEKNDDDVIRLYGIINAVPRNRLTWRLRLFAMAQCKTVLKNEIKEALLMAFKVGERYFDITGGAEYDRLLINCFDVLSESDQRDYIKKVFEYFTADIGDPEKEKWRKRDGGKILSILNNYLSQEEKSDTERLFGIIPGDKKIVPEPVMSRVVSGSVIHKSPMEISALSVSEVINKLKSDLSPKKLREEYKGDDMFAPRGPEGLGDAILADVKKRTYDYLVALDDFFVRDVIAPNYVYSLIRGLEELFRDKKIFNKEQIELILNFFDLIRKSGVEKPFEKQRNDNWLADWITVHGVMADVLLQIMECSETKEAIHQANRVLIKDLVAYFLSNTESPSKDKDELKDMDFHGIAINSVRGRGYQLLTVFAQNDGKELALDVKELYEKTLDDESLAVRFMIGRYLATFYFRDKDFIVGLLPQIFPIDDASRADIYLATWEGYLSNTLYDKLFVELVNYYKYSISLPQIEKTERRHSKDLDEALSVHLALAFAHLGLGIEDDLFKLFWSVKANRRHEEFISFIGRSCLTRSQTGDKWLEENKVSKEKLISFWDWVLANVDEPDALSGFGNWINPESEVLSDVDIITRLTETLKKSDGDINWDYGFTKRLPAFAKINGDLTLEIVKHYLLDNDGNLNKHRTAPLMHHREVKEALEIIYQDGNQVLKDKIIELIDHLIEKGSSMYWSLKEVIK
ncbi:MAG: hypothetical protein WCG01_05520 [bacterium]